MKKLTLNLLILFAALLTLAGCKKAEPDFKLTPKLGMIFDDNIDKVGADYKIGSTLVLKVAASGASTVKIVSNYNVGANAKTADLGSFPVTNGVATVSIPANSLRASADGATVGAGTAPTPLPVGTTAASYTRANNTYTLAVDAISGSATERRFYTAVLVQ